MITGPEVVTISKVGANVTKGVRSALASSRSQWPNAHEGLMELYLILSDWCDAAKSSNEAIAWAIQQRTAFLPGRVPFDMTWPMNMSFDVLDPIRDDIEAVLTPPAALAARLRRSTRRAVGRRTLHGIMQIYCPDLLNAFEAAADNRIEWILSIGDRFPKKLSDPATSLAEIEAAAADMTTTLGELEAVRSELHMLITTEFPMGVAAAISGKPCSSED